MADTGTETTKDGSMRRLIRRTVLATIGAAAIGGDYFLDFYERSAKRGEETVGQLQATAKRRVPGQKRSSAEGQVDQAVASVEKSGDEASAKLSSAGQEAVDSIKAKTSEGLEAMADQGEEVTDAAHDALDDMSAQ